MGPGGQLYCFYRSINCQQKISPGSGDWAPINLMKISDPASCQLTGENSLAWTS